MWEEDCRRSEGRTERVEEENTSMTFPKRKVKGLGKERVDGK